MRDDFFCLNKCTSKNKIGSKRYFTKVFRSPNEILKLLTKKPHLTKKNVNQKENLIFYETVFIVLGGSRKILTITIIPDTSLLYFYCWNKYFHIAYIQIIYHKCCSPPNRSLVYFTLSLITCSQSLSDHFFCFIFKISNFVLIS